MISYTTIRAVALRKYLRKKTIRTLTVIRTQIQTTNKKNLLNRKCLPLTNSRKKTVNGLKGKYDAKIGAGDIQSWIEEGGSWGENVEDEIEHRNAIVNGFLEEILDLDGMINSAVNRKGSGRCKRCHYRRGGSG